MSLLRPTLTALALVLIGTAAAEAQPVPSAVWTRGDVRWEGRDDRDRRSDCRNQNVRDRGPDGRDRDRDRARDRYPTTARDILLGRIPGRDRDRDRVSGRDRVSSRDREIACIHDDWHRRNDRYKGTREWDRRHKELLRDLERMRRDHRYDARNGRTGAGRATGRVN